MEQVLDALITYRDFINNAHIIEGQFHWLEGTGDAIKALEEALAKQKPVNQFNPDWDAMAVMVEEQQRMAKRIEELEAELAKQKQGEPVAYGFPNSAITSNQKWMLLEEKIPENDQYKGALWIPLYTTPQTKEWVKLTEKQIDEIYYKSDLNIDDQYNQMYEFVKAIELAHGIKE